MLEVYIIPTGTGEQINIRATENDFCISSVVYVGLKPDEIDKPNFHWNPWEKLHKSQ